MLGEKRKKKTAAAFSLRTKRKKACRVENPWRVPDLPRCPRAGNKEERDPHRVLAGERKKKKELSDLSDFRRERRSDGEWTGENGESIRLRPPSRERGGENKQVENA